MIPNYYALWDGYWRNYRISSEAAVQIALQQVPGQVVRVELDVEDGILVYEVSIRTTAGIYEVKINANTGQIIEVDRDFD
ncbi:peptidase [Clostridium botulinum]|nr:PepSY domain-containing protein [Clostridium botulinum]AJD26783.1 peptidase propeptide and YPEB domain protein [Clostridium botulinum CDC_297]EPS50153.1 peptidase domain-containing protein [Clostridium botulinum A1 str. CFSAN002368]APH24460.1 peptidase propeptide and YPEB domain protein [Clostridium botulinum]APQ67251.1 peptidase propeptide and YPEB domain protein [Clostridium botulinum]APR02125.1 peptidase propeptide and YPEB domain protein [Clostridium botulinum]